MDPLISGFTTLQGPLFQISHDFWLLDPENQSLLE